MRSANRPSPVGGAHTATDSAPHLRSALLIMVIAGPLLLNAYSFLRFGRTIRLVDEYFYYAHARSWYFDHDCDYENDLRMAPGFGAAPYYLDMRTSTGRVANNFMTGTSLVSLPFIALGDALTRLHNAVAINQRPRDGYGPYCQFAVSFGHTLVGVVGLLACYVLCTRYFLRIVSALAVFCVWLGTSAVYYVGYESPQSHALSLCMVALVLLVSDNARREGFTLQRALALGLCSGLMIVTRPQDLVWVAVPVVVLVPQITRRAQRRGEWSAHVGRAAAAVALATVCYIPQAVVNARLFGAPVYNTYQNIVEDGRPQLLHWTAPDLSAPLVDPHVGLLWTAPLAVLSIVGICGLLVRRSSMLVAVVLSFALTYYVIAGIWWRITGYGHRYFMSSSAAFALGLCVVLSWATRRPWRTAVVGTLVAVLVLWQVGLFVATDRGYREPTGVSPLYALLT
ncbi:MAG: hypothetical protein ACE5HE_12805 [Phycisphaerae bacterium]